MAAIPVKVGDQEFKTKKEALEFFRKILSKYNNGETINSEDTLHLHNLIERHPEQSQKIGCGIAKFYKDKTDQPTSCFWLERIDGTKTDFSFYSCIDAKGTSLYQEFSEACREAVKNDLIESKKNHFKVNQNAEGKVPCDITGEMISFEESHLDHKKPMTFEVIVRTFRVSNGIIPNRDILSSPKDNQFTTTFTNKAIADQFIKYHHEVADLRIIKKHINLQLGSSERIRHSKKPVTVIRVTEEN